MKQLVQNQNVAFKVNLLPLPSRLRKKTMATTTYFYDVLSGYKTPNKIYDTLSLKDQILREKKANETGIPFDYGLDP